MNTKIFSSIKKYLKNRKELVVLDLNIKNYNKNNFYIALVFNKKIEKFKIMFIPIDAVDNVNRIEDYVCYQFVNIYLVNHILETFGTYREKYKNKIFDLRNKNIDSYILEITYHGGGDDLTFVATRYIPKEWNFMFESLVILFEHVPNIMRELCNEILIILNDEDFDIKYNKSVCFDLFNDDLDKLFNSKCLNYASDIKINYLEMVNGKYFGIINERIIILEYIHSKKILNLYCSIDDAAIELYFYVIIKNIRLEKFIKFTKIRLFGNKYYLCFGYDKDGLKVIEGDSIKILEWKLITDGSIKFISKIDNNILEGINKYLDLDSDSMKDIIDIN